MKYTLLAVAALLPLLATARKTELGIGLGLSTNSNPNSGGPVNAAQVFSPCLYLHGGYKLDSATTVGLSLTVTKWNSKGHRLGGSTADYVYADPAIAVNAFANYTLVKKGKSHPYLGVSAGYVVAGGREKDDYSIYTYQEGKGFNAGLNLGYTYDVHPRIGLNIELAPRFAWVSSKRESMGREYKSDYNLFYFPLTVGVRCRL